MTYEEGFGPTRALTRKQLSALERIDDERRLQDVTCTRCGARLQRQRVTAVVLCADCDRKRCQKYQEKRRQQERKRRAEGRQDGNRYGSSAAFQVDIRERRERAMAAKPPDPRYFETYRGVKGPLLWGCVP